MADEAGKAESASGFDYGKRLQICRLSDGENVQNAAAFAGAVVQHE